MAATDQSSVCFLLVLLSLVQPADAGYSVASIWYFWFGMFTLLAVLAFVYGACRRHHMQRNRIINAGGAVTVVRTTATSSAYPVPPGGVNQFMYPSTIINPHNYQMSTNPNSSMPKPPPYYSQPPPNYQPSQQQQQQQPPPYGFAPSIYNDSAYPPPPPPTYASAIAPPQQQQHQLQQQQQQQMNPFAKAVSDSHM
ncbi:probable basic-leucine zipper transcription factor R [Littorina saxatilis]|uniref:Uncharacterized protein n=1 Tax=Littorina saxatilis TaxID=31220 RepID=A0AAN9GJ97_9CAEN